MSDYAMPERAVALAFSKESSNVLRRSESAMRLLLGVTAAVVGSEPEHLVDLQEDVDLGIGQVVDLGFGDVAAHTDGLHLQVDPAATQHLGQGRTRRAGAGLDLLGLLVHALPVGRIGGRPGGNTPPAREEVIQRGQVDDRRMGDRFELGIERGDVGGGQGRAYGGEGPLNARMRSVMSLGGHDDA
jgi:hypothetical protein